MTEVDEQHQNLEICNQKETNERKSSKRIKNKNTKFWRKKNKIRLFYCNINGIISKCSSLQSAINSSNSHICMLAETKCIKGPQIDNYTWVTKSREGNPRAGGVACLFSNALNGKISRIEELEKRNRYITSTIGR